MSSSNDRLLSRLIAGAFPVTLALVLTGCDTGLGADDLARAGDFRLEVEEAAQIIAPVAALPSEPSLVQAVADFWTDYTLLAWAVNREGEVDRLDISHVLALEVVHERIQRLRDSVIRVDEITDEELRQRFEQEHPGEEVRARHVLLPFPDGATPAQRDSVRALAEQIRDRARAGADFGELARTYSGDPGSAATGGDLGFFGHGQMILPFEEAAFALQPGRVSDVVQSEYGLHIIRLEERRNPTFEAFSPQYRTQVNQQSMAQAESVFLSQIEAPANVLIQEEAIQQVRDVTAALERVPSGRDAERDLTTYQGGSVTVGEFHNFLLGQPRELLEQIRMATDEQIDGFLHEVTRDELLVREANRRQIAVAPEEQAAFESELRAEYGRAAEGLGIQAIQPGEGESLPEAIDRVVKELIGRVVRGEAQLVPMGGLANALRTLYEAEVSEEAIPRVIERVDARRAEGFTGDARTDAPAPPSPATQGTTAPAPGTPTPTPAPPSGNP